MNIVIVNDAAHVTGGAGQVAIASAIGLAKRGLRVFLFSAVPPAEKELSEVGVEAIVTGQPEVLKDPHRLKASFRGIWNVEAHKHMTHLLHRLSPQDTVVHLHSWVKALSPSVIAPIMERQFPVVCSLHDYFSTCPNGGFFNYPQNDICVLRPLSLSCVLSHCDVRSYAHKLWRVARHSVQQLKAHMPTGVKNYIYHSSFSQEIAKLHLPSDASYIPIPLFIETERSDAAEPANSQTYGFIGRLTKEKGCVLLAEASRKAGVRCIFIGDGDAKQDILRINPEAQITGWLPHENVIKQIRSLRMLIYPTLWYETFGMSVLEAASAGVSSIVNRRCAARDLVTEGNTGLLFEGSNVADLATQIERCKNDDLVRRLGREAYQTYWSHPYTLQQHLDALVKAYESILQKEKPSLAHTG
jgi:glycosyltransferase involved in cell wall biosynthesis